MIDPTLLSLLCCPREGASLHHQGGRLACEHGHTYPVVDGIPVFILSEQTQTIGVASASLKAAESGIGAPLYVETLGLADDERMAVARDFDVKVPIDSAIAYLVGATSGNAYLHLIGRMERYPIPRLPLDKGDGRILLDVGASWGRWSVAARNNGWQSISLDPSLGALLASRRAFGRENLYQVCGDARFLPIKQNSCDAVFSYSVIQHLSIPDAERAVAEMGRVVKSGGEVKVQMAHRGGLRSTYVRTRPGYASSGVFRVRYWSLDELTKVFSSNVGPTTIRAEAFGGLGLLEDDFAQLGLKSKCLVVGSALLTRTSRVVSPLLRLADSVFVTSIKPRHVHST